MAFALSGSTITQSGTDTSLAGLNGIAGVTRQASGEGFIYWMPSLTLNITGTLTVTDQSKEAFICSSVNVASTGSYTSGTFASDGSTPLYGGNHFTCLGGADLSDIYGSASVNIQGGGRITLIGGSITLRGGVIYLNNAIVREYGVSTVGTTTRGASSLRFRAYSADVIKRKCVHYDFGYDMFRMPTEFSVKALKSEYVAQYVGALPGYDGAHARFVASALSNLNGTYDFDNYTGGWIELYDCASGADLKVVTQTPDPKQCVPLYQNINFTVTNVSGVAQQNVRFTCTDAPVSNTPTVTYTTAGNLKIWDFRSALTYTGTTDAAGKVSTAPVLQVWHSSSNLKNLRFPASTATFQFVGYAVRQQAVSVVLGADAPIAKGVALVPANDVTITEAAASAITGVAFVAAGPSGGTVTVSANRSAADLWHAWRYWKGLTANAASADSWEFDGSLIDLGAWSMVVQSGVSVASNLTTTGTITNNGTITGVYTDSTGTSAVLNVTGLVASSVAVVNSAGSVTSFVSNQTGSKRFYFAPGQTGTWKVIAERFGYKRQEFTFSPGVGGEFAFAPLWIPDATLTETNSSVPAGYADLATQDRTLDRIAYERTTAELVLTDKVTKDGTYLNWGDANVHFVSSAADPLTYNSGTNTFTVATGSTRSAGTLMQGDKTTGTITHASDVTMASTYEDAAGVRVTVRKAGGQAFNIYARSGTTGSYTDHGYQAGVNSVTYTVPKGTPIEVAIWSLGYVTYRRTISTVNGGLVFDADMTVNASINTSLDVSSYLAGISTSLDTSGASPVLVITFNSAMVVSGIELGKAIIHRIAGQELALRTMVPPGPTSTIVINSDEITVQLPAVRLSVGAAVLVTGKIYLDFFVNTSAALAISPTYDIAPPRADGNTVILLRVKPAIDPVQIVSAMKPSLTIINNGVKKASLVIPHSTSI